GRLGVCVNGWMWYILIRAPTSHLEHISLIFISYVQTYVTSLRHYERMALSVGWRCGCLRCSLLTSISHGSAGALSCCLCLIFGSRHMRGRARWQQPHEHGHRGVSAEIVLCGHTHSDVAVA